MGSKILHQRHQTKFKIWVMPGLSGPFNVVGPPPLPPRLQPLSLHVDSGFRSHTCLTFSDALTLRPIQGCGVARLFRRNNPSRVKGGGRGNKKTDELFFVVVVVVVYFFLRSLPFHSEGWRGGSIFLGLGSKNHSYWGIRILLN